ncbi:lysoplasmalogenase [Aquisphaera insulae]|uniref:lysoplasmalogenase n=1 Tax=Aquisphaera insulae TaxID=2712864 RepID=UPI0013EBE71B|nr:lysoplasmalogenase [Aquisphaera insulae]
MRIRPGLPSPEVLLAVTAAILYGWGGALPDGWTRTLVKMTPAMALAVFTVRRSGTAGWPVAVGLAWHAAGDGLLDLGERTFLAGLGAFLVGHLFYGGAFAARLERLAQVPPWRRLAAAAVVLLSGGVLIAIFPALKGALAVAVPLYSATLGGMVVLALLARWKSPRVPIGALSFLISDACLGLGLFGPASLAFARAIVWPTYAAAQVLIATGFVAECRD